jgi:hypothetical protein
MTARHTNVTESIFHVNWDGHNHRFNGAGHGLLYCRSSAEIITSRTPSAEVITLSAALSRDNNFMYVKCVNTIFYKFLNCC